MQKRYHQPRPLSAPPAQCYLTGIIGDALGRARAARAAAELAANSQNTQGVLKMERQERCGTGAGNFLCSWSSSPGGPWATRGCRPGQTWYGRFTGIGALVRWAPLPTRPTRDLGKRLQGPRVSEGPYGAVGSALS